MKPIVLVFLGLVGAGATLVTLTTDDEQLAIITGLIGVFTWLLVAYGALGVTIYDQTGSQHTDRYPAMAVYGVMMAVPNLYVALTGPLHIVRERDQLQGEVR